MSIDNRTPFPALAFRQYNLAGTLNGVVAVRGTFSLDAGTLRQSHVQWPLVMSDAYDGEPLRSPQIACTDLAPFKPGTDVTYLGYSYAPGGLAQGSWTCGINVGPVGKDLRVSGARAWRPRIRKTWKGLIGLGAESVLDGWDLTDPVPTERIPIDWRLAYGGATPGSADDAYAGFYPLNPVGRGMVDPGSFLIEEPRPAPQIEAIDMPFLVPDSAPEPQSLGPVAPFWRQRQRLAGSYDDEWLATRHPLLPEDFDYHFWQCAPPGLVAEPWLSGDENYSLRNLIEGQPEARGRLPGIRLRVRVEQADGWGEVPLVLDGVHFDMRPDVDRVFLTWRAGFPWTEKLSLPVLEHVGAMEGRA